MGNNEAYSIFEATVVGAYNLGVLDKKLLAVLMEPYRGTDIDAGGKEGLTGSLPGTVEELEVEEICIKVMGGTLPPRPDVPDDYRKWTEEQERAHEEWLEARSEAFGKIEQGFGWC